MDQLRDDFFAPFGPVISTRIVSGRTGESLRFGFIEMASEEEAVRAQQALHRTWLEEISLIVTFLK